MSFVKHGLRGHYLYGIWAQILQNCYNPKHRAYRNYGARGIDVCPQWRKDPEKFITDILRILGPRPPSRPSLRLKDFRRGYYPNNVRWDGNQLVQRFWVDVAIAGPDECWFWQGLTLKKPYSYGLVFYGKKLHLAHRISYILNRGEIPAGMEVCHSCDNPLCVNPAHLFLDTRMGNVLDAMKKGRIVQGINHSCSKLDPEKVKEIRLLRKQGFTYKRLAQMFGVGYRAIWNVVNAISWKSVA